MSWAKKTKKKLVHYMHVTKCYRTSPIWHRWKSWFCACFKQSKYRDVCCMYVLISLFGSNGMCVSDEALSLSPFRIDWVSVSLTNGFSLLLYLFSAIVCGKCWLPNQYHMWVCGKMCCSLRWRQGIRFANTEWAKKILLSFFFTCVCMFCVYIIFFPVRLVN